MSYIELPEEYEELDMLCESLLDYTKNVRERQLSLFGLEEVEVSSDDIPVVELFAGVGGFRIGLERASKRFKTVWNSQWEPSTKRQDASIVYCNRFGTAGHSNEDIATVPTNEIPDCKLLVGGFPCQDYSVATTLARSGGIEGKKGVLWWQIYRILKEKNVKPQFLMLENVDRLLNSPATQRGRDFAIILASLSDLGYVVEWRVVNAADYGMPQRRRRTYIVCYQKTTDLAKLFKKSKSDDKWIMTEGVMAQTFPSIAKDEKPSDFMIDGDLTEVSDGFNKGVKFSPFGTAGVMCDRHVYTRDILPNYDGPYVTLGMVALDEKDVPEEYFITPEELPRWEYLKGSKSEVRTSKDGYQYNYTEGGMAFPDYLDKASRTIITGEGGKAPSRFKHIILCPSGRYRRLTPLELERLNMFPDNHTKEATDVRRAFLMGNALVTGIVEQLGLTLLKYIK